MDKPIPETVRNPNIAVIEQARDTFPEGHSLRGALDHAAAEMIVLSNRLRRAEAALTAAQQQGQAVMSSKDRRAMGWPAGDTAPPSAPVGVECNCPGAGKTDPELHKPPSTPPPHRRMTMREDLIERLRERAEFEDKRVLDEAKALGFVPEVYNGSQTGVLLREAAAALEAAREDALALANVRKVVAEFEGMTGSGYRYMAANVQSAINQARGKGWRVADRQFAYCCAAFSEQAMKLQAMAGGGFAYPASSRPHSQFEPDTETDTWNINGCCGGGCFVVSDMRYCPYCGSRLVNPLVPEQGEGAADREEH